MSSWLSKNYEKASIGGAAVAALGLAFLGWSKVGAVKDDFSIATKGSGPNNPAVASAPLVAKATSSFARKLSWPMAETEGRAVDLFTGIPLFIKKDPPDTVVDLLKSEPIHPPIPNTWWIKYRLSPGDADSPALDPDGDGYSNLEEYEGKTDPTDDKSHPPLIDKLKYVQDESIQWALRPTYPDGDNCPFTYQDSKRGKNKSATGQSVKPNETFFGTGDAAKDRFKFKGLESRKEMNKGTHVEELTTYAKVEDLKDNKKGAIYEFKVAFPQGDIDKWSKFDRSAVLSLQAGEKTGQETIEENTRFGLPFDNPKKDYLLKKVTPESIEVEVTDPKTGDKSSVSINKGAFPAKAP